MAVSAPDLYAFCLLRILAVPLLVGGCVESGWTVCPDGRVCDEGRVCDVVNRTCSSPDEECLAELDRSPCAGGGRICLRGKCVDSCGDGVVDAPDQCEAGVVGQRTCTDFGMYEGEVLCSADCTLDTTGCSGECMDGHLDRSYEACDPTDLEAAPGLPCVALGYDAGRQSCASNCADLTEDQCMQFGWSLEDPVVVETETDAMQDVWGTSQGDLFVLVSPGGVRSAALQGWVPVGADGDAIEGRALWASSSGDIWVIDNSGIDFVHWNGAAWVREPSVGLPGRELYELWGSSAQDVFAVGNGGAVLHFDGKGWIEQPTPPSTGNLMAVWGVSSDEVYAAGERGSLIRYDGGRWSTVETGTSETLTGVWAASEREIWTVSATGVRRFDGVRWSPMLSLDAQAEGRSWIAGTGPSDVWVSGGREGMVWRYDGARWTTMLVGDSFGPQPLWVDRAAAAVGFEFGSGHGMIRRWRGAGPGPALADYGAFTDAWGLESGEWIAVGADETGLGVAVHGGGSTYTFDESLDHVTGFAADRAHAAGSGGTIYAWDGKGWSVARPGDGAAIAHMWTSGSSDLYAATPPRGAPTRVLHHDGVRWTELPPLPAPCVGAAVRGWASSPENVFVVGRDVLARFDGTAWTCLYEGRYSQNFASVWGSAPDDVWIFEPGLHKYTARLLHWDGNRVVPWHESDWLANVMFVSGELLGTAADDVFLGSTAHFDGRVWSPLRSSAMGGTPVFAHAVAAVHDERRAVRTGPVPPHALLEPARPRAQLHRRRRRRRRRQDRSRRPRLRGRRSTMTRRVGRTSAAIAAVIATGLAAARPALADPHHPLLQGEESQPLALDPATVQPWSRGISVEQKARARQLLAHGNELLVQNRYAAALEQYELAIRAWDHPAIRANMVVCFINLARPLEAYESALLALQYGPAPLDKPEVYAETQNYRKLLEGQIGVLEVSCGEPRARVTLDGQELLRCPGRTRRHVIAGRHQLVGYKTGFLTVTRDFTSAGGAAQSIDVRLVRLSDAARIERQWDPWKPWAVTASGAALMLAGGLLQLKADSDMDRHDADLERLCGGNGCAPDAIPRSVSDRKSRALLENKLAIGGIVTGGAVAVVGLVGVYLNRPRTVLPGESGAPLGVAPLRDARRRRPRAGRPLLRPP